MPPKKNFIVIAGTGTGLTILAENLKEAAIILREYRERLKPSTLPEVADLKEV